MIKILKVFLTLLRTVRKNNSTNIERAVRPLVQAHYAKVYNCLFILIYYNIYLSKKVMPFMCQ